MDFGEKLVKLREAKGLSQYEVADRLGIKRPRYNAWEQGIAKPRADMIKRLAEFFEVSPDYLLGFDKEIPLGVPEKLIFDFKKLIEDDIQITFDGVPLSEEDVERVRKIMETLFFEDLQKKYKKK